MEAAARFARTLPEVTTALAEVALQCFLIKKTAKVRTQTWNKNAFTVGGHSSGRGIFLRNFRKTLWSESTYCKFATLTWTPF